MNMEIKEVNALKELVRIYDENPRIYIEKNLFIKDKAGRIVPLKFNEPQLKLDEVYQRQRKAGKPIRIIVLKARREGISTQTAAYGFEKISRYPNMNGLVITHEPDSTEEIFGMTKLFYEMLPENEKPMKKYDNVKQLTFENPDELTKNVNPGLRSKIRIATANKVDIGRGTNIHFFHGSEVAYWNDADKLLLSIKQAVPEEPNTIMILESTANGVAGKGKHFHDLVMKASRGEGDMELVFIPWFELKEYFRPFTSEAKKKELIDSLTDYEKWLIKEFNLSYEQLNWRRWAIINKADGDIEKFQQEYPATIQEAFIASSGLAIPRSLIDMQVQNIRKPEKIIEGVRIYEMPKKGHYYSLGGDSAEGEGGDDAGLSVFDKTTGREVASFNNDRISPKEFGKLSVKVAKMYNNAIITPEVNHPGVAYIDSIKETGYPNIYRREVEDKMTREKTQKIGFRTTGRTKPNLLTNFKELLRQEDIAISTEETINQMFTFVKSEDQGKYGIGAAEGSKDDLIMATMLAIEGFKMLP